MSRDYRWGKFSAAEGTGAEKRRRFGENILSGRRTQRCRERKRERERERETERGRERNAERESEGTGGGMISIGARAARSPFPERAEAGGGGKRISQSFHTP